MQKNKLRFRTHAKPAGFVTLKRAISIASASAGSASALGGSASALGGMWLYVGKLRHRAHTKPAGFVAFKSDPEWLMLRKR